MSISGTSVYFFLATVISCIPAAGGIYARCHEYKWLAIFLYALAIVIFVLSIFFFVAFKLIQQGTPFLLEFLDKLNRILAPIVSRIAKTKFVGPVIGTIVRANFFIWFVVLLLSDRAVRILLGRLIGPHASKSNYSIVNAVDPKFELFDPSLEDPNQNEKRQTGRHPRPEYSRSIAYTLAVASRLAYEDVDLIQHELEKDGFDVKRTFLPMAFKNICAYIAEKDDNIFLVFRGTNPMNIQNFVTDFNIGMADVRSPSGVSMGKVHKGFWEAMGDPKRPSHEEPQRSNTLQIELSAASLYRTIRSTIKAATDIGRFAFQELLNHVYDPIDNSWIGHDRDIRNHSMYAQAEEWIMALINNQNISNMAEDEAVDLDDHFSARSASRRKHFYVAGHSLGGALATIFVAKMLQSQSPLLNHFYGLYSYGHPKIGDDDFTRAFPPEISTKAFHHTYNNDIVPRVPPMSSYGNLPGTLVFIDSEYKVTLYPPNPRTNEPVPVRPISFIHLSGLLNANVIRRLPQESWLRVTFRLLFPFFINDHIPSDYCHSLRKGTYKWVVAGGDGIQGGTIPHDEESAVGMSTTSITMTKATRRHFT